MAREDLHDFPNRIKINYLTDLSPEELIAKTSTLPDHSIILYAWQQVRNSQGKLLETNDVLGSIAAVTPAPIFGLSSPLVGRGIVGGYVYTPEAAAGRIADMTVRIARGESVQSIPIENTPTVPMF